MEQLPNSLKEIKSFQLFKIKLKCFCSTEIYWLYIVEHIYSVILLLLNNILRPPYSIRMFVILKLKRGPPRESSAELAEISR